MIKFYKVHLSKLKINNESILQSTHSYLMLLFGWYEVEQWMKTSALGPRLIDSHDTKMKQLETKIEEYERENNLKKELVLINYFDQNYYYEPFSKQLLVKEFSVDEIGMKEALSYFLSISNAEKEEIKMMFQKYKNKDKEEIYYNESYEKLENELEKLIYPEFVDDNYDIKRPKAKIIPFPKKDII